jgi:hypothetical protein
VTETKPAEGPKPATTAKPANAHRRQATTAPHAASKTAHKTTKHHRKSKTKTKTAAQPGAAATQNASPKKVVVRNGSTKDPAVQLSPSLTQQQSSSQRQNVNQLLSDTDANLKTLSSRRISSSQNDTMNQIQQYVQQAKAAADAGDMERARNLAVKAHVLSEELVKH